MFGGIPFLQTMGSALTENWNLENGEGKDSINIIITSKEHESIKKTAHNLSTSLLRKKSDPALLSRVRFRILRQFLVNVQQVVLGTKLCVLIPAIPLAILAHFENFARPWVFALSLLGLAPLAERVSFLTEQTAYFTGPTVGGLLNATCGNATELIIAIFALYQRKTHVLKYSLLGSILSNLLLVLGTSLFCGGLANLGKEQRFDKKQADVNSLLLLLGLLCHVLPLVCKHAIEPIAYSAHSVLWLSRGSSICMLLAYVAYLIFQLKTGHVQICESDEEEDGEVDHEISEESPVIGLWSALIWLIIMTVTIAILSEYVVGTIEAASDSWGISVSFISLIILPIVGNAAEHAGSIIFAFKNKLDISLGVALGSGAQISMFVVPVCVVVGWIIGVHMDLDFHLLETCCLAFSILFTTFTLQDGTSHYMKGVVLCLSYAVIATCFFFHKIPKSPANSSLGKGSF